MTEETPKQPKEPKPRIVAVDRNPRNAELLTEFLRAEGYVAVSAASLEELEVRLNENDLALVLLDVSGFGNAVWDLCQKMKQSAVPFVIIYGQSSAASRQPPGAHGLVLKPLQMRGLRELVKDVLESQAA